MRYVRCTLATLLLNHMLTCATQKHMNHMLTCATQKHMLKLEEMYSLCGNFTVQYGVTWNISTWNCSNARATIFHFLHFNVFTYALSAKTDFPIKRYTQQHCRIIDTTAFIHYVVPGSNRDSLFQPDLKL